MLSTLFSLGVQGSKFKVQNGRVGITSVTTKAEGEKKPQHLVAALILKKGIYFWSSGSETNRMPPVSSETDIT